MIFKRTIDNVWRCTVRLTSGKAIQRSTGCRHKDAAEQYARLLQRDIERRAELGDLLPPPRLTDR